MSTIITNSDVESMLFVDTEVQTWTHDDVEVYSAGKMVTYYVDSGTVYEEKVKKGQSCLSPTTFTPTKTGWTFVGWREDTTASGDVLDAKVMDRSPIALYAVFKQTIKVTYYNNSTTASTATGARYYNNGNIADASFTLTQAAKSGWTARGWSTATTANASVTYSNATKFSLSADITLYGLYQQTITLSYNANGGASTPASQTGTRYYNSSGNAASVTFTLASGISRSGYTFRAWSLNSSTGTIYNAGATITLTANATMYARWYQSKTVTGTAGGMTGKFQSGGVWEGTVSFGVTFASTPTVSTSIGGSGYWSSHNNGGWTKVSNITTTSFYLYFNVNDNPGNNYNYETHVDWTATGLVAV